MDQSPCRLAAVGQQIARLGCTHFSGGLAPTPCSHLILSHSLSCWKSLSSSSGIRRCSCGCMLNDRIDAFVDCSDGDGGVFRLSVGVGTTAIAFALAAAAPGEFGLAAAAPTRFRDLAVPGVVGCFGCVAADAIFVTFEIGFTAPCLSLPASPLSVGPVQEIRPFTFCGTYLGAKSTRDTTSVSSMTI